MWQNKLNHEQRCHLKHLLVKTFQDFQKVLDMQAHTAGWQNNFPCPMCAEIAGAWHMTGCKRRGKIIFLEYDMSTKL